MTPRPSFKPASRKPRMRRPGQVMCHVIVCPVPRSVLRFFWEAEEQLRLIPQR